MQLPSLRHITQKTTLTLQRFPLVLLSAMAAVFCAIYATEQQPAGAAINLMLVAGLGIPLFTAMTLAAEKNEWQILSRTGAYLLGILLLVIYYFTLPADLDAAPAKHVYRYLLYIIGLHLLVAISPYWGKTPVSEFWQYNKTLFLRFLTAVFFSGMLFAGLAIAMGAVQVLLEVDIDEIRYLQLFIILGGIFNTWFFLAGIPRTINARDARQKYPKGLRIFTQNILIPLVIIYLLILYIYTAKILLQWQWPEGWVANLILTFSIIGILAVLLLYPIRNESDKGWIKRFSKGFFVALVPLAILLLLAIYRRIWDYGFTVERYFVLVMGLWLAVIVAFFLFSKSENIKAIPASLCILAFLISFGPWGAFAVSEQSQINRLEYYLTQNKRLENHTIQQSTSPVLFHDRREISSIVRYLNETHGLQDIQPWFDQDLNALTTTSTEADTAQPVPYYNRPQHVVELMGMEYVNQGEQETDVNRGSFSTRATDAVNVDQARWLIQNLSWSPASEQWRALGSDSTLVVTSNEESPHLRLFVEGGNDDSISVDLVALVQQLRAKYPDGQQQLTPSDLMIDLTGEPMQARLYFQEIGWQIEDGQLKLQDARFYIMLY